MIRRVFLSLLACTTAQADPWEASLASVASLRTGGASLVSSDSLQIDNGQFALITYWEARTESNLDFYRCVDITDSSFATGSEQCWRALRPTGRAPRVAASVTSTGNLCGQPDSQSGFGEIAFCGFSDPFTLETNHFRITLDPFENGGLVAVRDEGRYLLVTDEALPASAFFEVRMDAPTASSALTELADSELLSERIPDARQCEPVSVAGREWLRCDSPEPPLSVAHYLFTNSAVFTVAYNSDNSPENNRTIESMFRSLRLTGLGD